MSTTAIIIGIAPFVIGYLIGRHFKSEKVKELEDELEFETTQVVFWRDNWHSLSKEFNQFKESHSKFQVVPNIQKHHAANDNYLYVEGEINGNREAGMLRFSQWEEAKETLLKNPEDKPL